MPYFAATLGGTNGKINVIGEKEVESKLRTKIHKNSPACFPIFKSQGTAKEILKNKLHLSKAAVSSSTKYNFNNAKFEPYLKKSEYMQQ